MRGRLAFGLAIIAALLLGAPAAARACTLDNVASVSANGEQAILSTDQPRSGEAWAPFRFAQAYAIGSRITLGEERSDLAKSLPADMLSSPFRWVLGDGSSVRGTSVSHAWARQGTYLVRVYAYAASRARWLLFDSVLIQIVPSSQLGAANLGYHVLQGLNVTFSWLGRVITAGLAILLVYSVASYVRGRRGGAAGGPDT